MVPVARPPLNAGNAVTGTNSCCPGTPRDAVRVPGVGPNQPHYRHALRCHSGGARLAQRFERNGAPLVLRLDRASVHDAPPVRQLLEAHGVLVLHGPPRYPCFYGQLERQNREHRAWAEPLCRQRRALIEPCLVQMLEGVNSLWRRRTLGWQTAAELWSARPPLGVDRTAFRQEVLDRALRIARTLQRRGQPADLAERLAIQQTLERMGFLRQQLGGWC